MKPEDDDALLPCPFCGGEADYIKEARGKWLVECQTCIISTSVPTHGKKTTAVYWNIRTSKNDR